MDGWMDGTERTGTCIMVNETEPKRSGSTRGEMEWLWPPCYVCVFVYMGNLYPG